MEIQSFQALMILNSLEIIVLANMILVDFKELLKLFREVPFSIRIESTCVEINKAILACEFFTLTQVPIPEFSKGDSEVYEQQFVIDIQDFLDADDSSWKDIYGTWHKGVLSSTMRSMLLDSLAKGELQDSKYYKPAEVVLEFYLQYISMYPRVDTMLFEGEEYHEHKGLATDEATRVKLLNFFLLEKTKYLYSHFGVDAVHWMNYIRTELGTNQPTKIEELEQKKKELEALKKRSALLLADLGLAKTFIKQQKQKS